MTIRRTDIEMKKLEVLDGVRTAVRFRQRMRANRELNDKIMDAAERFDLAVQRGELIEGEDSGQIMARIVHEIADEVAVVELQA